MAGESAYKQVGYNIYTIYTFVLRFLQLERRLIRDSLIKRAAIVTGDKKYKRLQLHIERSGQTRQCQFSQYSRFHALDGATENVLSPICCLALCTTKSSCLTIAEMTWNGCQRPRSQQVGDVFWSLASTSRVCTMFAP